MKKGKGITNFIKKQPKNQVIKGFSIAEQSLSTRKTKRSRKIIERK